jgi:hypothetical protein
VFIDIKLVVFFLGVRSSLSWILGITFLYLILSFILNATCLIILFHETWSKAKIIMLLCGHKMTFKNFRYICFLPQLIVDSFGLNTLTITTLSSGRRSQLLSMDPVQYVICFPLMKETESVSVISRVFKFFKLIFEGIIHKYA